MTEQSAWLLPFRSRYASARLAWLRASFQCPAPCRIRFRARHLVSSVMTLSTCNNPFICLQYCKVCDSSENCLQFCKVRELFTVQYTVKYVIIHRIVYSTVKYNACDSFNLKIKLLSQTLISLIQPNTARSSYQYFCHMKKTVQKTITNIFISVKIDQYS